MSSEGVTLIHGQWWSILRMQRLQMRQWWARGGRNVSHREHTVHSSSSSSLWKYVLFECKSEKSSLVRGSGTMPGSQNTALRCAIASRKMIVLKSTTLTGPQSLLNERGTQKINI